MGRGGRGDEERHLQRLRRQTEKRSCQCLTWQQRSARRQPAAVSDAAASAPSRCPSDVYPESLANAPCGPPPGATLTETGQKGGVYQSGLFLMLRGVFCQSEAGVLSHLCSLAKCVLQVALLTGVCVHVTPQSAQLVVLLLEERLSFPFPAQRLTEF